VAGNFDWFDYVKNAGGYASPLLLGALIWLDRERNRLLGEVKIRDEKLEKLAERLLTVAAELKTLFDRKGSGR
jgi:hypothetical protein